MRTPRWIAALTDALSARSWNELERGPQPSEEVAEDMRHGDVSHRRLDHEREENNRILFS